MKSPLRKLEDAIWEECKRIIFKKYGNVCYTCGQRDLEKQNRQCGHYYPKGALGAKMKYDLRILRPQCFNCNINYGGMGAMFREKLRREIGVEEEQKLFDECVASKAHPIKAHDHYLILLEQYRLIP